MIIFELNILCLLATGIFPAVLISKVENLLKTYVTKFDASISELK